MILAAQAATRLTATSLETKALVAAGIAHRHRTHQKVLLVPLKENALVMILVAQAVANHGAPSLKTKDLIVGGKTQAQLLSQGLEASV
jgi:hypothetical protein